MKFGHLRDEAGHHFILVGTNGDSEERPHASRALFDEELRKTYSFEKAFDAALPVIRAREKQYDSGAQFSNPQFSQGMGIATRLRVLEGRLGGGAKRAEAP